MKKIAFIGNGEPPDKLLELFRRFTPGKSGVWKNLYGVGNYKDADVFGVIDWLPSGLGIDETRCVFLGAHPETMQSYYNMANYKGIKMYDCQYEVGFLEWWLRYDYDYLSALKPMKKTKQLGCIVSNADKQLYHKLRRYWLERFTNLKPQNFDLHGRIVPWTDHMKKYYRGPCGNWDDRGAATSGGNDHMTGKEQVYEEHKYMIEFDATGKNYFSERVLDCLLLWSMPIYWGGEGLQKYLPSESFISLNIHGNGEEILQGSDVYESRLPAIAEARNLLLNKYQIWPRIHEAIFGEP